MMEFLSIQFLKKQWRKLALFLLSIWVIFCILLIQTPSIAAPPLQIQAKQHFDRQEFSTAIQLWKQALDSATQPAQQIAIHQALATTYQALGQWSPAKTHLDRAQQILDQHPNPFLQAKTFNIQASLLQNLGQHQAAIATWQQAEQLYRQGQDPYGIALSQLNQAQALQTLGRHRQARALLAQIQILSNMQDSDALFVSLNLRLGITLQALGEFSLAKTKLESALSIAAAQGFVDHQSQLLSELANFDERDGNFSSALARHQLAQTLARSPQIKVKCLTHQFHLLLKTQQIAPAQQHLNDLQQMLETAPNSRWAIEAVIYITDKALHHNLLSPRSTQQIKQLLDQAETRSQQLGDPLSTMMLQGTIGHFYEHQQNPDLALKYTRLALQNSETPNTYPETTIPLHWQEGRLLRQQGRPEAIAAYALAVDELARLRQDLVTIDQAIQFSFRDQVEPVYKEYVELLLTDVDRLPAATKQQRLIQARETIESLQLTELQDFLKEACNSHRPDPIAQIPAHTALIYPIVLDHRLEVITALPHQPLVHHYIEIEPQTITMVVNQLRASLNPEIPADSGLPAAQQLYNWIIRPLAPQLKAIETLVFVPNGFLRNIPLGILHNGQRYLIEDYNLALATGLKPIDIDQKRKNTQPTLLLAGLSQARQGFTALNFVEQELQAIAALQPSTTILLNQNFSLANLHARIANRPPTVIHLATHGQFSAQSDKTFLLTWNDRLNLDQIRQWLQEANRRRPLDLLVLSACQTAKGDNRAQLGLAGMAIKSGAASTIATLWNVNDQATAQIMTNFYQNWRSTDPSVPAPSKAQALRQAQLRRLHTKAHQHPYYWAGVVLIGDWQ